MRRLTTKVFVVERHLLDADWLEHVTLIAHMLEDVYSNIIRNLKMFSQLLYTNTVQ